MEAQALGAGHQRIVLEIHGDRLDKLDRESGGHRFQRVPPTERRGRVHTSTVTVAVLAGRSAPSSVRPLEPSDLRVEWFSGTGKGGQHRNKHQNCCRMVHLPTGIVRTATGRERGANRREALDALTRAVREREGESAHAAVNEVRRGQLGSGERGDKIRTYRAQDDRVVDHRSGRTARFRDVMAGEMAALLG